MTDADVAADVTDLSPAEEAFFESKGEKAEGLGAPEQDKPVKDEDKPEVKADKSDEKPDDDGEETVEVDNRGRFVRHGAFHKERMQRKALEQQLAERNRVLAEREQAFARVDERLKLLSEAMQPRQEQVEQKPDPETDPIGAIRYLEKRLAQAEGKATEAVKMTEAERADQSLAQTYRSDAMRFSQSQKDFGAAYSFLLQGRDAELQAYGMTDPAERMRTIHEEEKGLVARAMKDGASPAERLYALAKARGYALKEPEPKPSEVNDKAREVMADKLDSVSDKIDTIARGQAAAKSLSNAGGSPSDSLSAESLANMSEEEFAAVMAKMSKSEQRALMGG